MSRIYERRKSLGLSQAAVARLAGIPQTSVSHYEMGNREMGAEALGRFAQALACSADYLLGLTDDPTPGHLPAGLTETEQKIVEAI